MEVILKADNGLSNEEVSWAIANIPNDSKNDKPGRVFDHTKESLFEACGFTAEHADSLKEELSKINKETPGTKKSEFIERVLSLASDDLRDYLVLRGVIDIMVDSKENPLDDFLDFLRKMK